MRRDFLRTLFARMLATYLTVTLTLILIVGVTVVALFQEQLRIEKEDLLVRDLRWITQRISQADGIERTQDELQAFVQQSGDLLVIRFLDGRSASYYYAPQWKLVAETNKNDIALLSGATSPIIVRNVFGDELHYATISAGICFDGFDGSSICTFLHRDNSASKRIMESGWMEIMLVILFAILCCFIAVYFTTTRMTKPFMRINDIVERYSKGDFNIRIPISGTDEATQLARSFNNMADQLKDLEATRRSFVANVSHELRSPLTSMRGFLEAMQDGTIGREDYDKYIDIVLSETRRMTSMVNDLLDLARIESGKTAIQLSIFDINELIRRTLITFEARIYDRQMEVEVKFAQEQYFVEADTAQISQVLRNIIDNAIKYSPISSKLRIATYALRKEVYVSIQDYGQGIPEEDVPHVFDRFYKVEKAHTPSKQSGTGLGLSIVKRIIDQHGQTITLKSVKGKGSNFTFTLKRAPSPNRRQPIEDGGAKHGVSI